MITIWWAPLNPTAAITNNAIAGDIFVSTNTREQRRKNGSGGWDVIVPPDTRGDAVPWGFSHAIGTTPNPTPSGAFNDRLAVIGNARPWESGWVNAAAGIIGPPASTSPTGAEGQHVQTAPMQDWQVDHRLGATVVDVTVISSDGDVLVPEIEYASDMGCTLHFIEPVTGTAIVRR